jgi:hypothetical protein
MKEEAEVLNSANERTTLLGVRVSAGLLAALGYLWGFYALFCIPILGITGILGYLPFTLLVGLWWCIYLNLPHVRAYLVR